MGHWYRTVWSDPKFEINSRASYVDHAEIVDGVNLRHARKQNLFPGITTIISEMARPGLERWKQLEVASLGMSLALSGSGPAQPPSPAQILRLQQEQVEEKAKAGSLVHKMVEDAVKKRSGLGGYLLKEILDSVRPGVTPDVINSERAMASPLGYASKIDLELHYLPRPNADPGPCAMVDIKTKDEWPENDPPKIQEEHMMQLAACRDFPAFEKGAFASCQETRAMECWIAFISREPQSSTGKRQVHCVQISEEDLERGLAMFKACNMLFQLRRKFYPGKR